MLVLKDGGHGVTKKSLEFWSFNRSRIGKITHIEVSREALRQDDKKYEDITYKVDYTLIAHGEKGEIWLSGCNCGYSGEGPNGTARILAEFGFPLDRGRLIMLYKRIDFRPEKGEVLLDGVAGVWEALKEKHLKMSTEAGVKYAK